MFDETIEFISDLVARAIIFWALLLGFLIFIVAPVIGVTYGIWQLIGLT